MKKRFCVFARISWFLIGKRCTTYSNTRHINNVVSPVAVDSFHGFHLDYYKKFTAFESNRKQSPPPPPPPPHLHLERNQQTEILNLRVQVVLLRNHLQYV